MKSTTYKNLGPLFNVSTHESKDKNPLANHLQGSGIEEIDSLCSKILYRIANPKAKPLENSKLDKNGGWRSMSRNQSLEAVEHKKVSTDELQDCWQTLQCMCFQNIHLQHDGVYKMFAACRDILRINNRKSDRCDSLDQLMEGGFDYLMPHKSEVARTQRAMMALEQRKLVHASYAVDTHRQKEARRKTAIRFLRSILDGSISRLSKSTRSERASAFRIYTSIGCKFNAQSVDAESLEKEMTAI